MQKQEFINQLRSLYNIDGHLLPELSSQQQLAFLRAPVTYFLETDKTQSDAIMREINVGRMAPSPVHQTTQQRRPAFTSRRKSRRGRARPSRRSRDRGKCCFPFPEGRPRTGRQRKTPPPCWKRVSAKVFPFVGPADAEDPSENDRVDPALDRRRRPPRTAGVSPARARETRAIPGRRAARGPIRPPYRVGQGSLAFKIVRPRGRFGH